MKKLSAIMLSLLIAIFFVACNGEKTNKNGDDHNADTTTTEEVTPDESETTENDQPATKPVEELLVGNWSQNEGEAISGFDIVFMEDGSLFWHSGTDEGEDTWQVVEGGKLVMFGLEHDIVEISETSLKISDGEGESNYTRVTE